MALPKAVDIQGKSKLWGLALLARTSILVVRTDFKVTHGVIVWTGKTWVDHNIRYMPVLANRLTAMYNQKKYTMTCASHGARGMPYSHVLMRMVPMLARVSANTTIIVVSVTGAYETTCGSELVFA